MVAGVSRSSAAHSTLTQFSFGRSQWTFASDAIARGPRGQVWFAADNGVVGRLSRAGRPRGVARFSPQSPPSGIAVDPAGNAWLAVGSFIARVTPAGVVTRFTAGISPGASAYRIAFGPDGNMWFTEYALPPLRDDPSGRWRPGGIGRITPTGQITEFDEVQADPRGYDFIASGPDKALWFTSEVGIGRITTTGVVTQFRKHLSPRLFGGITAGPGNRMWFTDDDVRSIAPNGTITRYYLPLPHFTAVIALAHGPGDAVWIAEQNRPRFGRLSKTGHFSEPPVRLRRGTWADALVAANGAIYYIATNYNGAISTGRLCLARC